MSNKSEATSVEEFLSLEHLEKAMATRSLFVINQTYLLLTESKAPSKTKQNELFALEVQKMARTHLCYILFKISRQRVESYPFVDAKVKVPLELLVKIFAVKQIMKDPQSLYECGFFKMNSGLLLNAAYKQLLVEMRPHMIPFVEYSKNLTNGMLSTIGNDHGDIIET